MANASRARGRAGTAAGADAHAGMNTRQRDPLSQLMALLQIHQDIRRSKAG
jgi:hypothetical protein